MPHHLDSEKDRGDYGHVGIWGPWPHDGGKRIPSLKPPRLHRQLTISISNLQQDAHVKQNGLEDLVVNVHVSLWGGVTERLTESAQGTGQEQRLASNHPCPGLPIGKKSWGGS